MLTNKISRYANFNDRKLCIILYKEIFSALENIKKNKIT